MKSAKRMTAFVTLFLFLFTSVVSTVTAAGIFADVDENTPYAEAIERLYEEKIVDGYLDETGVRTYKPDATITRAEFAKLLVVAQAKDVATTTTKPAGFADVDEDPTVAWAIPYIAYAVDLGVIDGYEDGTFRPNNEVLYAEAVKMAVCALGYTPVIPQTDPWYTGYITVANQVGITARAASAAETPAPRGLVAQIICNMLDSDPYDKVTVTVPGGNGSITSGTIIDNSEEPEEEFGQVEGVYDYTLTGMQLGLSRNEVQIDNQVYVFENQTLEQMKNLLGYEVEFTYTVERSKRIIGKISASLNDEHIISDYQIESVDASSVEYYKDGSSRPSTLSLSDDLSIIYNGSGVGAVTSTEKVELLDIDNGEIRFVDNGQDGQMDVAFVSNFETYVVGTISAEDGVITDKYLKDSRGYPRTITLDPDAEEDEIVYTLYNAPNKAQDATFNTIKKNSVISVAMPYENGVASRTAKTEVRISTITVKGKANSDSGYITIDDEDYEMSSYYEELIAEDSSMEIGFGETGTFYLDYNGKVVTTAVSDNAVYGYLIDVLYDEAFISMDEIELTILAANASKPEDYTLKSGSKISVNGGNVSARELIELLKSTSAAIKNQKSNEALKGNGLFDQPIIFETTSGMREIRSIKTVASDTGLGGDDTIEYDLGVQDGSEKLTYASNAFKNSSNIIQFSMTFTASSTNPDITTTKVFVVPDDRYEVDDYQVYTKAGYFTSGKDYYVEGFNVNQSGSSKRAEIVVVYGGAANVEVTGATPAVIVDSVRAVLDPSTDDERTQELTYYELGKSNPQKQTINAEMDGLLSGLKQGDIIKFATKNGKLSLVEKVFVDGELYKPFNGGTSQSVDDDFMISEEYNGDTQYYNAMQGTVTAYDGASMNLLPGFVYEIPEDAVEEFGDDEASYIASQPVETYTVSSGTYVLLVDSQETTASNRIKFISDPSGTIRPADLYTLQDASKVFIQRRYQNGAINAIVIYR